MNQKQEVLNNSIETTNFVSDDGFLESDQMSVDSSTLQENLISQKTSTLENYRTK